MTSDCANCAPNPAILLRGVDVRVLGKILSQQKLEGRGAVALIAAADVAPLRGAVEPGKGTVVDVVA